MPQNLMVLIGGPKMWALIGGAIGAALGVAISPPMSKRQAWLSIFCGIILGGSIAPVLGWKFNIPTDLWGYVACIIAVPGIGLAAAIIVIAKDPIGAIKRLRGTK
jgi:hypothetical protein